MGDVHEKYFEECNEEDADGGLAHGAALLSKSLNHEDRGENGPEYRNGCKAGSRGVLVEE